jgi:hypothetical protein
MLALELRILILWQELKIKSFVQYVEYVEWEKYRQEIEHISQENRKLVAEVQVALRSPVLN